MIELIKVKAHVKIWSGLELKPKLNLLQISLPRKNDFSLKASDKSDKSIALSDVLSLSANKVEHVAISPPLRRR